MLHKIPKIAGIVVAGCVALLAGCAAGPQAGMPGVYELTGNDEGFSVKFPDGKRRDIVLAKNSDHTAREAIRVLHYSIFISTQKEPAAHGLDDSAIYFVGIPGRVISGRELDKDKIKRGYPYEPSSNSVEFELRGWFIKIPYIEYPDVPDWAPDNIARRIKRTTLEPKDFKEPIDPRVIHYDKAHQIYWIGMNPFESR